MILRLGKCGSERGVSHQGKRNGNNKTNLKYQVINVSGRRFTVDELQEPRTRGRWYERTVVGRDLRHSRCVDSSIFGVVSFWVLLPKCRILQKDNFNEKTRVSRVSRLGLITQTTFLILNYIRFTNCIMDRVLFVSYV